MAETGYDVPHAKFEGFGTYKLPDKHVNELIKMTKMAKKEFPQMDNDFIWLCAVDYVLEGKGWKKDDESGAEMYEDSVKERRTLILILDWKYCKHKQNVEVEAGERDKMTYDHTY